MTTSLSASSATAWQIKDFIEVTHHKITISLYPVTSAITPIGERAFAAMANKSSLDTSMLTPEQLLIVFAKQVDLASWDQGEITDWQRALNRGWLNFRANVTILDLQNSAGTTMININWKWPGNDCPTNFTWIIWRKNIKKMYAIGAY